MWSKSLIFYDKYFGISESKSSLRKFIFAKRNVVLKSFLKWPIQITLIRCGVTCFDRFNVEVFETRWATDSRAALILKTDVKNSLHELLKMLVTDDIAKVTYKLTLLSTPQICNHHSVINLNDNRIKLISERRFLHQYCET